MTDTIGVPPAGSISRLPGDKDRKADQRGSVSPVRRTGFAGPAAAAVGLIAIAIGVLSYFVVTGLVPVPDGERQTITVALVATSLGLMVVLVTLIGVRVWRLWRARQDHLAGSRLHIQIVRLFSVMAVVPAIIVATFSGVSLSIGLQTWFSERVGAVMENSVSVAEAYVAEHVNQAELDAKAMALDLSRAAPLMKTNPRRFVELFGTQAFLRSIPEAVLVDGQGRVMAHAGMAVDAADIKVPGSDILTKALAEGQITLTESEASRLRAVVPVAGLDAFLITARSVDPAVLEHVSRTRSAITDYRSMEQRRSSIEVTFAAFYILMSLLVVFSAMWLGMWFAERLVAPLSDLIGTAEKIGEGDLTARAVEDHKDRADEVGVLARSFNDMTSRIEEQQTDLLRANEALDSRRRFTEAVLGGVTAGVIGLDPDGNITLPNRSAADLLKTTIDELMGQPLAQAIPEMAGVFARARDGKGRVVEDDVVIGRGEQSRSLHVRVTQERVDDHIEGYVVTFDDMTRLVSAQRMAAWADIARRIAHEIKNPLTPIQLSAERLRRKYASTVEEAEIFDQCTNTIIRQVGDIGKMVDEFSSFARMPRPVMAGEDLTDITRQAVFLQDVAHQEIEVTADLPSAPISLICDRRLISQALTNVLKNAVEAVEARLADDRQSGASGRPGRVHLGLYQRPDALVIEVTDNGMGLPRTDRDRLVEPYMTTREKGTGLGLAIVAKIMDDHGGSLTLDDATNNNHTDWSEGALIRLTFPLAEVSAHKGPTLAVGGRA